MEREGGGRGGEQTNSQTGYGPERRPLIKIIFCNPYFSRFIRYLTKQLGPGFRIYVIIMPEILQLHLNSIERAPDFYYYHFKAYLFSNRDPRFSRRYHPVIFHRLTPRTHSLIDGGTYSFIFAEALTLTALLTDKQLQMYPPSYTSPSTLMRYLFQYKKII